MVTDDTQSISAPPLEIERKHFRLALAIVWLAIVAVQAAVYLRSEVSVRDATGSYLPMARAAAAGDWEHAQTAKYPPAYPILVGLLSRWMPWAEYPEETAGIVVNAVAMHLILVCVLLTCLTLWSRRVALAAVGLTGLNPRLLAMSVNVWVEPCYAALLTLCALMLVACRRRIRWWAVVGLGLGAGLAAMFRGEGVVMPLAALAGLVLCHAGRSARGNLKLAGWCVLGMTVVGLVWLPRILYVYDRCGVPIPDIRIATILRMEDKVPPSLWRVDPLGVDDPGKTLAETPRQTWRRPEDTLGKWLLNNLEALLEGWNPVVLVLAVAGLFWRRPLRRYPRLEGAMGILIAAQLLATALGHDWQRRYVATVAPIVTIFGAVGMVALTERIRLRVLEGRPITRFDGWSTSMAKQLGLLAILLLACSIFCIRLAQRTRSDLRYAGEYIASTMGPGLRIMADTPTAVYYARGRLIVIPDFRGTEYTLAQLRQALRESRADLLVFDAKHQRENPEHRWCPEFYEDFARHKYQGAEIPLTLPKGAGDVVVYDVPALLRSLQGDEAIPASTSHPST